MLITDNENYQENSRGNCWNIPVRFADNNFELVDNCDTIWISIQKLIVDTTRNIGDSRQRNFEKETDTDKQDITFTYLYLRNPQLFHKPSCNMVFYNIR